MATDQGKAIRMSNMNLSAVVYKKRKKYLFLVPNYWAKTTYLNNEQKI